MLRRMLRRTLYRMGLAIAPGLLFTIQHYRVHRRLGTHTYLANIRNPRTFNEYMLRSKLDKEHMGSEHLVDKYEVKSWVKEKVGFDYIIPTLGVFNSATQLIDSLSMFPCVIKPTHLSGRVIFLRNEKEYWNNRNSLWKSLDSWLSTNFFYESGEIQYRGIPPRLLVEPDLSESAGSLADYKFFCFGGAPEFIQVDSGRRSGHQRFFMTLDWKRLSFSKGDFRKVPPHDVLPITEPENLSEMIQVARALSKGLKFVRVDLYETNGLVKFGEMTFHPGSGTGPFSSFEADLEAGRLLRGALLRNAHAL